MNTRTILFSLPLVLLPLASAAQETAPAGEEKVTELQELVVKGDNVWIEGNKVVFKPQKSAKNLATDATSLIERMHTGLLQVKDGQIVSPNGLPVDIYINGVKADGMDLSTFWPKNALRVEYFESSDDPRFAGAARVVNFIMKEYVTGGLTKLNADQTFPNNGTYSVSSKLVYKKMTYNAIFSGGYDRDHLSGDDRRETYSGIWYDGTRYDLVDRDERTDFVNRSDKLYGGLNARYGSEKLIMTHAVALQWTRNPESTANGQLDYTPGIIDASSMRSLRRARSLSPSISGNYSLLPANKLSYVLGWNFNHTHNNNFSEYSEAALSPILNNIRENTYNYGAAFNIWFKFNPNLYFNVLFSENRSLSSAQYTGTTISNQWQQTGHTKIAPTLQYKPLDNLFIKISPEIELQDWNVDHTFKKTSWLPGISGNIYWTINRKNSLSGYVWYNQRTPLASMRNDLILRQTELKWLEGNPTVKSNKYQHFSLNWFSSPLSWFSTTVMASYAINSGNYYIAYRPGGMDYDGVIGQYHSAGRENTFGLYWDVSVSLFDGHVNIHHALQYDYSKFNNELSPKVGNWYSRPSISWDFGNCSLSARYSSPQKTLTNGGTTVERYPYQCDFSFSYGNGNFNLDIEANNVFKKRMETTASFNSGPYSYVSHNWSNGRSVSVSLTYTFDYGKKVDPGVDIYTQNIKSSAILGGDK